ncbi:MBL fold metallo-hydrolase [Dactylosporangium sp. NPDC051485]|uniref:MBL fold metallo-hydrolase n=1 Tax=Dactylosporangium sp. NPDC051485 TaxID=3154846 RepID=UPI0034433E15
MTTGLEITKLSVGPMDNNAYLLRCRTTGSGVLIDAANEAHRLLDLVSPGGIQTVVTTHRHADHWMALEEVVAATGASSLAHPADAPEIPVVTGTLDEGDTLKVGDCALAVIHLVGHTPGSIALYYAEEGGHLFTGDSLFPGGVGNTHGNKAHFDSLFHDVTTKLFDRLPDEVTFYPGHGKNSTLGTERPSLKDWRERGW